ncbi:MAG: ornithine carbamoyltransferase, partial [Pseudomonadota bacterium]
LLELAEASTVPVINGLTNRTHPCQIMADVMTFEEHRGPIAGKRIAWFGDGNNVCASWIQGAAAFGYELVISGPETLDPDAEIVAAARAAGATVTLERDPAKAAAGADALVTDTWVSMHDDPTTRERRHNQLRGYQVNEALMAEASPDAILMHCLPAHRDEEVSSAVFDGPQSVVFDEAENRLHAQKSILRHVV